MKTHQPCEACGSSDALTSYEDHTYCFACETWVSTLDPPPEETISGSLVDSVVFRGLKSRGISLDTCRKYCYGYDPSGNQVAPYYARAGSLVYQKVRSSTKEFWVLAGANPPVKLKDLLWGTKVFGDSGGSRLLITEGEVDALTGYEALGSLGFHVVSISSGVTSALGCIQANFDWIDRYTEIYLGFDNDEPGRTATEEVLKFLGSPRVFAMNIPDQYKDLNDMWRASGHLGMTEAFQLARGWKPSGILTLDDLKQKLLETVQLQLVEQ